METLTARPSPSSDMMVWRQVFVQNQYQCVLDLIGDRSAPLNIIDAGANVGYSAAYFARKLPNSRVLAIEPDFENFEILRSNLQSMENVSFYRGALWKRDCCGLEIRRDFRDGREWALYCAESERCEVWGHGLEYYMHMMGYESVDILKMDIEGGEAAVFDDDTFLRHVKILAVEIHDEFKCRKKITASLRKYGFYYAEAGELTVAVRKEIILSGSGRLLRTPAASLPNLRRRFLRTCDILSR